MTKRTCPQGHHYTKASDCPVCPICEQERLAKKKPSDLPKIGAPATRALESIGVEQLRDLTNYTEQEVLDLHGMGPKALGILKETMDTQRISFRSL